MAEVAKILSPNKEVLLPDLDAGCTLEQSCQPEEFEKFRKIQHDFSNFHFFKIFKFSGISNFA